MYLKVKTNVMKKIISHVIEVAINNTLKKRCGSSFDISINDLEVTTNDRGQIILHIDCKAVTSQTDLRKLFLGG